MRISKNVGLNIGALVCSIRIYKILFHQKYEICFRLFLEENKLMREPCRKQYDMLHDNLW
jgi:hypothetical protein